MSDLIEYAFKPGVRVPRGVTISRMLTERDYIKKQIGKLETKGVARFVERQRKKLPAYAAWCTWDVKAGMEKLHEQEISYALSSIVLADQGKPLPIKESHLMVDTEGVKVWVPTIEAMQDRDQREAVWDEISEILREAQQKFDAYRKFMRLFRVVKAA